MSADTTELDGLVRDLGLIPSAMIPKVRGVVAKAAMNTKNLMRKDASGSKHFKQLVPTISYDLKSSGELIEAEIGPVPGGSGSLAGIAYYGTSRPGGGTVRTPEDAMMEEAPSFYEFAFKATEGLL